MLFALPSLLLRSGRGACHCVASRAENLLLIPFGILETLQKIELGVGRRSRNRKQLLLFLGPSWHETKAESRVRLVLADGVRETADEALFSLQMHHWIEVVNWPGSTGLVIHSFLHVGDTVARHISRWIAFGVEIRWVHWATRCAWHGVRRCLKDEKNTLKTKFFSSSTYF